MRKIQIILFSLIFAHFNVLQAQSLIISEIMSSNFTTNTDEDGDYSDWMEIYNAGKTIVNLADYSLTDDKNVSKKWVFPNVEINSESYLLIFASGKNKFDQFLHTNFKINSDGEKLWFRDSFGNLVDSVDSVSIPTDVSLGRSIDDPTEWVYFINPTPGAENDISGLAAACSEPVFSHENGFYENSINLELIGVNDSTMIYFTLDGSIPNVNSNKFQSSILIDKTTVLKARCIVDGMLPSKIVTKSFFINQDTSLPVISISTDPDNLWDEQNGIYVDGNNGITGSCSPEPKNYNQDWEKPINIEFFETDKTLAFNILAGVKIYGGCSRTYPQKSLAIYARRKYGFKSIDYPIFHELPYEKYEAIVLRNSGDDYYSTFMRDALMHNIVRDLDLETQAYRPSVVFLNGEYWGIHNIREKINENYIAQHHNVDPDHLDLLEKNRSVITGDANHYNDMISFIENNDLALDENYNYLKTQMDTDNFISYCLAQIYFDNTDWPGHNIKFWRSKNGGKWRWILYDTDFGFGFKSADNYMHNTLEFATTENGEVNANQPWATFLLRKLLENNNFKQKFITTYSDFSNTIFNPEIVTDKITSLSSAIDPEIPRHIEKWGEYFSNAQLYLYWQNSIRSLKNFAQNRLSYLNNHFINKFNLSGNSTLKIIPNNPVFGKVEINSIEINQFPWSGNYFDNIPIQLNVLVKPGIKFIGWEHNGSLLSTKRNFEILLTGDIELNPIFELDTNSINKIVINEINYDSNPSFDSGDWLEITNISTSSKDLSNWKLIDENSDKQFTFSNNIEINPNEYLVIVEDSVKFQQLFPNVKNYIGNFGFRLNNEGELLQLFDNNNFIVDSLKFENQLPWPIISNGSGSTIELSNPIFDNSDGTNWYSSSAIGGTPGALNSENPLTTSSNFISDKRPNFTLQQNYPNPFNPITNIFYSVPISETGTPLSVSLKVYDVLGNLLEILVNKIQNGGNFDIQFNGSNYSSGVYYYQLRAGKFVQTKKMLLIK